MLSAMFVAVVPAGGVTAAEPGIYVVQPGDTLFSLARRAGLSVAAVQAANGLQDTLIAVGQRLRLPGAVASGAYRVVRGDTLFDIALRYGISVSELRANNGLIGSDIFDGQVLVVGSAVGAAAQQVPVAVPANPSAVPAAAGALHMVAFGEIFIALRLAMESRQMRCAQLTC